MKVLIVGAGAVGSVYGHFARSGGAQVSYLVRAHHRERLAHGFSLYEWKFGRKTPRQVFFREFETLTEVSQVDSRAWDLVILAIPSSALDAEWLKKLFAALKSTPVLALLPGTTDREQILATGAIPPEQLVMGGIPIISYLTPLRGETLDPGAYAYLLPPGSKMFLEGEEKICQQIQSLFSRGGLPCQRVAGTFAQQLIPATLLTVAVAGLRKAGWSFRAFGQPTHLSTVAQAAREAIPIAARMIGVPNPMEKLGPRLLIRGGTLKTALNLGQKIFPFDLEACLQAHYTKLEKQMNGGLIEMVEAAEKSGLPHSALDQLL